MSKVFRLITSFLVLFALSSFAQTNEKEEQIVESYFDSLRTNEEAIYSPNELMVAAALWLLNTPYVAGILEKNTEEYLVVNLQELDCMTFVENCLAMSRSAQYPNFDYDYFIRELKKIRYRNGVIQGYTSRLHYTSDWIYDNTAKGEIEDITYALGGKKFKPDVYYMSSHPDLYPALKNNQQDMEVIIEIEKRINQRNNYYYIPRNEIRDKTSLIKSGDIICFTTELPGLDISHMGIAYWHKGQLSFIHASSTAKKVIINPESIGDYCLRNKNSAGIIVLRELSINSEQ
jgi:cell wall-associated NlpC family hydrolase